MQESLREKIIVYIRTNGRARAHDLSRNLPFGRAAIHRNLKKLTEEGILLKNGKAPVVFYVLAEQKQAVVPDSKRVFGIGIIKVNMFQKISTILIWSENFRKLSDWYKEVFDLKVVQELDHPQDTGVLYEFPEGSPWIWIGQHSEIHGQNKDPLRMMFNINVDSVQNAFEYLKNKGIKFIAKPFKAPTMNKYFATFSDPDGNTIQLIGPK